MPFYSEVLHHAAEGQGPLKLTRGGGAADGAGEHGFDPESQAGLAEIQTQLAARCMHGMRLRRDDDVLLHGSAAFQAGLAGIDGLV